MGSPAKNIYYNSSHIQDIKTSVLYVNNKPNLITLDYFMNVDEEYADSNQFRLSYYPHTLNGFSNLCKDAFGPRAKHTVYADFKTLREEPEPSFYIHVVTPSSSGNIGDIKKARLLLKSVITTN